MGYLILKIKFCKILYKNTIDNIIVATYTVFITEFDL